MRKRKKRKRTPVKRGGSRWFFSGIVFVAAVGALGWWLVAGSPDSRVRKACLDQVSMVVDRIDQLSDAWEKRSTSGDRTVAGTSKEDPPSTSNRDTETQAPPASPQPERTAPVKDEITEQDQEQLKELLKEINKSD